MIQTLVFYQKKNKLLGIVRNKLKKLFF